MSVDEIYNYIRIDDFVATAGQPSEDQLRSVRDAGYEVVINLAPDGLETSLPDEAASLGALGVGYHQIPVVWSDPLIGQLRQFERLMAENRGRRILVHCQANYRVTVFFALYAGAALGWTDEQADALIDRIWTSLPDFEMDATWKAFIDAARQGRQT